MDNRAIGIFDSGLGGLTVLKEIRKLMPRENTVYFGDCGRVPYGTKSKETVLKYTYQDIEFLMRNDIKMIIIACNTASACSYRIVKDVLPVPVIEVILPGVKAAVRESKNKNIGVIGTTGTISSGVYEKEILSMDPGANVYSVSCPMFVPLAEEGWWNNEIALMTAEKYLAPLREKGIDTLVLGCTHYPLLKDTITKVMGENVKLVNSGYEVALTVQYLLKNMNLESGFDSDQTNRFFTSDSVEKFEMLGSAFLDEEINSATKIDIEKY